MPVSQARWSPLACGVSRGVERDHIGTECVSFPCGNALTSNWAPQLHASRLVPRPGRSRPPTPTRPCFSTSAAVLIAPALVRSPPAEAVWGLSALSPRAATAVGAQAAPRVSPSQAGCMVGTVPALPACTAPQMWSRLPTWPCGAPSQTPANLPACLHPWALSWALPALSLPAGFPPPGPASRPSASQDFALLRAEHRMFSTALWGPLILSLGRNLTCLCPQLVWSPGPLVDLGTPVSPNLSTPVSPSTVPALGSISEWVQATPRVRAAQRVAVSSLGQPEGAECCGMSVCPPGGAGPQNSCTWPGRLGWPTENVVFLVTRVPSRLGILTGVKEETWALKGDSLPRRPPPPASLRQLFDIWLNQGSEG